MDSFLFPPFSYSPGERGSFLCAKSTNGSVGVCEYLEYARMSTGRTSTRVHVVHTYPIRMCDSTEYIFMHSLIIYRRPADLRGARHARHRDWTSLAYMR